MKKFFRFVPLLVVIAVVVGCGYTAYLGMHGTSIKLHPDIHEAVAEDRECLECHHPDNDPVVASPHPNFIGCLKCHNDDIDSTEKGFGS